MLYRRLHGTLEESLNRRNEGIAAVEPHATPPSIEDQLTELRATVANLHAKMLDQHTKTYAIIGRLVDANERAECSIDDLRAKLKALDNKMRENDSQLAEAIALLLDENDADGSATTSAPALAPAPAATVPTVPTVPERRGSFAGSGLYSPTDPVIQAGCERGHEHHRHIWGVPIYRDRHHRRGSVVAR
jgi:hypothetical protein